MHCPRIHTTVKEKGARGACAVRGTSGASLRTTLGASLRCALALALACAFSLPPAFAYADKAASSSAASGQSADTAASSQGSAAKKDGADASKAGDATKKDTTANGVNGTGSADGAGAADDATQTQDAAGQDGPAQGGDASPQDNVQEQLSDDMPAEEREAKLKEEAESLKGKADQAASRLSELASNLETSYEDLNQINKDIADTQNEIASLEQKIEETGRRLEEAKAALGTTAKEMYCTGGESSFLSVLLGSTDFEAFISNAFLLNKVASGWQDAISEAGELSRSYTNQKNLLSTAQQKQSSLQLEATRKGVSVALAMSDQSTLLENLDSSTLEKARELDGVTGGNYAASVGTHTGAISDALSASESWYSNAGDSTSREGSHPAAVEIARQYLGVPYVWAGASPSGGFDCSGLVLYVYAQLGIDLPHFARSQYDCGQHIAYSALMPGDLVFFGSSVEAIHHVGIYIGDGQFLHAPQTGDVVKISNLSARSDLIGACRPL